MLAFLTLPSVCLSDRIKSSFQDLADQPAQLTDRIQGALVSTEKNLSASQNSEAFGSFESDRLFPRPRL